ncbi:MAG TPA: dihydroorotase [Candidatus Acidoferrales bacterium]|nr:dihydroorotase [Candidatus Acidoferrales bacterium]
MSGAILIRGGTVVDPANGVHGPRDVLVKGGKVAAVVEPNGDSEAGAEVVDVTGCLVLPGLIDMHAHLREPGYEYKETIASGARAAVAGGFSAVACMANTNPVNDSAAVTEFIRERAMEVDLARVYPIGAVSKGLQGEELAEIGEMHRAGIVAVSDDGMPIMNGGLMRRALEYAAMFRLPVIVHEEERSIAADGVMNEGTVSLRLGLKGIPAAAEEAMIARDIALLERTGGRLHIAHLSTAGAVELVRHAKRRGVPVTAEATPHHFTLTEEAVDGYNTNAKMNPPLRTRRDVDAVRQGLADGTIDVIATDHAPHHRDEKECEFDLALNGIIGLETAVPLALRMAEESNISLDTLVTAMSVNPARILGVPGGSLAVGSVADVTVVDPQRRWKVEAAQLQSKSRNTPFEGVEMHGQAIVTMVGGRIVWRADAAAKKMVATV